MQNEGCLNSVAGDCLNLDNRQGMTEVVLGLKKHGLVWPPPSKKEQRSMRRKEGS